MHAVHALYDVAFFFVDEGFGDGDVFNPTLKIGYKDSEHDELPEVVWAGSPRKHSTLCLQSFLLANDY